MDKPLLPSFILVRVNKISISSRDNDTLINWYNWPTAPDVGQVINLEGEPYYVIEKGWAASEGRKQPHTFGDHLYCYIRVFGYTTRP